MGGSNVELEHTVFKGMFLEEKGVCMFKIASEKLEGTSEKSYTILMDSSKFWGGFPHSLRESLMTTIRSLGG